MTALFGFKTIAILAEDNPWLVESSRRHDIICELYNQLNGQIDSEQVPSDTGPKEVQRYNDYEQKVNELQEMMLEWDAEAKHFLQYPNLSYSSLGKFDDDQRREMKDHVVRVVSMRREDLARSRMVLTHNYEGLINDAAKAVNLKKVQESIDKANVANELAMESNKISERSLEQSGSSHRVAWAGVWLALGALS